MINITSDGMIYESNGNFGYFVGYVKDAVIDCSSTVVANGEDTVEVLFSVFEDGVKTPLEGDISFSINGESFVTSSNPFIFKTFNSGSYVFESAVPYTNSATATIVAQNNSLNAVDPNLRMKELEVVVDQLLLDSLMGGM